MFRRRTSSTETTTAQPSTPTQKAAGATLHPEGKGRPTPKRREAEAARKQRMSPPRDRRAALRQQRQQQRESRAKVQQALQTGDERYFPARDRGPVRGFARDYVDSRRTLGEFLLPLLIGILLLMMVPIPAAQSLSVLLWLATLVLMPVQLITMSRGLRRQLRERFPDENHKGITMYAIMRSTQMRRLRLPKPRVRPGDTI